MRFPSFLGRRTFLMPGNAAAYQAVTDGLGHGPPPLSSSLVKIGFAAQLRLPHHWTHRAPRCIERYFIRTTAVLCMGGFAALFSLVSVSQGLFELSCPAVLRGSPSLRWQISLASRPAATPRKGFCLQTAQQAKWGKAICSQLVAKPTFALFH